MSNEGISRQYDNKELAKKYNEKSIENAKNDPGRLFLRSQLESLPRTAAVVDLGCGGGIDLKTYQEMGFANLVGIEPSEKSREVTTALVGSAIKIVNGTFENTGLQDNSVDAVVSRFAMHYSHDIQKSLFEVARILKDGGLFAAVVSHPDADSKVAQNADGTITITLFNRSVPITFPLHTREEYFGKTFNELFDLKHVEEYIETEQDRGIEESKQPNALCFVANRKIRA